MLTFDKEQAKQADQINSAISESGKYIGVITRAEKLLSINGTDGLGLSFKSDSGATSDYLDLYTKSASGAVLPSAKIVQAILGCLKLKQANDGPITCEKYSKDAGKREVVQVNGYPELMGKRIGLLLQKELSTNEKNGKDVSKMIIVGVFQADTELTVSEMLAGKTTPETLPKMVSWLAANPVNDRTKSSAQQTTTKQTAPSVMSDMSDDIPW